MNDYETDEFVLAKLDAENDPLNHPCPGCFAEAGEPCHWGCLSYADRTPDITESNDEPDGMAEYYYDPDVAEYAMDRSEDRQTAWQMGEQL